MERLRSDLIDKAVSFLLNDSVSKTSSDEQTQFLKTKGMTDEEIGESFRIANLKTKVLRESAVNNVHTISSSSSSSSGWRDMANIVIVIGGATYLTTKFIKEFIWPFLFGESLSEKKRRKEVYDNIIDVQNSMKFLVDSVQQTYSLARGQQTYWDKLCQTLDSRENSMQNLAKSVDDLKREITLLKNLLVSSDQFPPLPIHKPFAVPSWQKINNSQNGDSIDQFCLTNGLPSKNSPTSRRSSSNDDVELDIEKEEFKSIHSNDWNTDANARDTPV